MEKFSARLPISRKNRDLGNRVIPPSHMNTSFYKGFSGVPTSRKPGQPAESYEEALNRADIQGYYMQYTPSYFGIN